MKRLIFFLLLYIVGCACVVAQSDRDFIRRGNRFMRDTVDHKNLSVKAVVQYKKAINSNSSNAIAHYNLGNAFVLNGKVEDAMKEYQTASKLEKNKDRLSDIYHNMGVIFQAAGQYDKALECYKLSLRNNPLNDETRYNYVLCQRKMKNKKNDDKNDKQNNQDKKQQNRQDKKQQKQQNKQQQKKDERQQKDEPMSKDNAEQMLNAAIQKEKDTQEKVQRQQQRQTKHLEKQW